MLNTDNASATIDPVSPVFAGSNKVLVSLASLEKACIYCSASLRATAFSPPDFSMEEATTYMLSAVALATDNIASASPLARLI